MKGSFQFKVNGDDWRVAGESINMTLLACLRARGLTGAKCGCDEGGCGACTVVLVDRNCAGERVLRSIYSCVTPLPTLADREIITVEGLCDNGALHPAQDAMARCAGAPCGYCVPGFVMSLFEGYYRDARPDGDDVREQLGGVLCRCGGYRAIGEAGEACLRESREAEAGKDRLPKKGGASRGPAGERFAQLLAGAPSAPAECAYVDSEDGRFYRPLTMTELMRMRAQYADARLVAGGIESATRREEKFRCLVSLEAIPELRTLMRHNGFWEVGAGVCLTDIQEGFAGEYPALDEALARFGSRPLRNRATFGGCLVSPSPGGEIAVVLSALDAVVRLVSADGEREMPVEAFYRESGEPVLRQDELVKDVRVPRFVAAQLAARGIARRICRAVKVSKRRHMDDGIVTGCFALELSGDGRIQAARLAFGGVGHKPAIRARRTESFLEGRSWDWETAAAALPVLRSEIDPHEDELASAEYRAALVVNLIEKFYRDEAAARSAGPMAGRARTSATGAGGGAPAGPGGGRE